MKTIFKYISLLIFSGLIIHFCYQFKGGEDVVDRGNAIAVVNRNNQPVTFRIIKELAKIFTPILKSENNL